MKQIGIHKLILDPSAPETRIERAAHSTHGLSMPSYFRDLFSHT